MRGALDVDPRERLGRRIRSETGNVEDRVHALRAAGERLRIADVGGMSVDSAWPFAHDLFGMAGQEADRVPPRAQGGHRVLAHDAAAAGDQDLHAFSSVSGGARAVPTIMGRGRLA